MEWCTLKCNYCNSTISQPPLQASNLSTIHTLDGLVETVGVRVGVLRPPVGDAMGAARGVDMGWQQQKQNKMNNIKHQTN